MTRYYENMSGRTLAAIHRLHDNGVNKISVILRHSERFFTDNPNLEPFMKLTDIGKDLAFTFGKELPPALVPRLHSSYIGRCIETAYLVDKGFTAAHGHMPAHPEIMDMLSPYYIRDIDTALALLKDWGDPRFIRKWFNKEIDTAVIDDPERTADRLCRTMTDCLDRLPDAGIAVCISHDWNLYPIKEFKLDLPRETAGDVGYMEGILFFKQSGRMFLQGNGTDAVPLSINPGKEMDLASGATG